MARDLKPKLDWDRKTAYRFRISLRQNVASQAHRHPESNLTLEARQRLFA